jgi:hypothetical protein
VELESLSHKNSEVDPSMHILDNGVDALSLHRAEVSKKFEGIWYSGCVVDVCKDPNYPKITLFKVLY